MPLYACSVGEARYARYERGGHDFVVARSLFDLCREMVLDHGGILCVEMDLRL